MNNCIKLMGLYCDAHFPGVECHFYFGFDNWDLRKPSGVIATLSLIPIVTLVIFIFLGHILFARVILYFIWCILFSPSYFIFPRVTFHLHNLYLSFPIKKTVKSNLLRWQLRPQYYQSIDIHDLFEPIFNIFTDLLEIFVSVFVNLLQFVLSDLSI